MRKAIVLLVGFSLVAIECLAGTNLSSEQVLNRTFRNDSISDGRKTVATAASAEALSSTATPYGTCTICAETDNTGVIAVGGSTVVAALGTRRGIPLNAGSCYTFQSAGTLSSIYLDTTVNGDGVTYVYTVNGN